MSWDTHIMLKISAFESDMLMLAEINVYIEEKAHSKGLVSINDSSLPEKWYGGDNYFEDGFYVGVYAYFPLDEFISFVKSLDWEDKNFVQLIIKERDEFGFKIIGLT